MPLPPAETINSALELSREHGQSVASTHEWMKGSCHAGAQIMERSKGRNMQTTTTKMMTSPILKQTFFITQDQ